MLNDVVNDFKTEAKKSLEALQKDLGRVRTGRATPTLLDGVKVSYYGVPTPLNQVASVAVAEARLLTVSPWEKSLLSDIERAIQASNLGVTPANDGKIIRIQIPALTGERRKELVKQVKKIGEDFKVAVRGHRRDANEMLKGGKEDKEISEDDYHRGLKRVQDETDLVIKQIDAIVEEKEKEITEF